MPHDCTIICSDIGASVKVRPDYMLVRIVVKAEDLITAQELYVTDTRWLHPSGICYELCRR